MVTHRLTYNVWFNSCVFLVYTTYGTSQSDLIELGVDVLPKRPPDSDLLAVLGDPLFLPILLSHTAASLSNEKLTRPVCRQLAIIYAPKMLLARRRETHGWLRARTDCDTHASSRLRRAA